MSAASTVRRGRRAASKHVFRDLCLVERRDPDGVPPEDMVMDEDGQYPDPPMLLIYRGPFAIQVRSDINANAVEGVVGDIEGNYRTATMQFPVDTPATAKGRTAAILPDDQLTVVRCILDREGMEGRVINLQADTKGKTHATMRRFRSREPI